MPRAAQEIAVNTFNTVFKETKDENKARMVAINDIKREFKKVGDKWVPKGALVEVSLIITKATIQPDGSMRWQCVASETTQDNVGEFTTLPLFQDWIYRAKNGIEVPFLPSPKEHPFLGISHYPDLDGLADAGPSEQMYIDGNRFKASGFFYNDNDHPLGKALFNAVRQESELIQKGETIEKPIRISAAWWDLAHLHGNFSFERKSINDICPMCAKGQKEDKQYLKGQLDHFAATRVPIHSATSLDLEQKSMTTRKEDANSIIDDPELVDEIDRKAKLLGKSETEELVTKAKTKTIDGKPRPAGDFLVVDDAEKPGTWSLPVKVNGKLDRRLMGAAWAALHKGFRGQKFEGPGKQEAIDRLKKFYKQANAEPPSVGKADLEIYEDILSGPDIQQMHMMYPRDRETKEYGSKYDRDKYQLARDEFELDQVAHRQEMLNKYGTDFVDQHGFMLRSDIEKFGGDQAVAIANNEGEPDMGIMPFNGAVTIKEATDFIKANDMLGQSRAELDILNTVLFNIFELVSDPIEQIKLVKQANKDFNKRLAKIKATVVDAILIQPLDQEKGEIMQEQTSTIEGGTLDGVTVERAEKDLDPMQAPFDNAYRAVKKASKEEDQEKRKELFTRAMGKLGKKVEQMFKGDVVDDMEGYIDIAVQRAMAPIAEQLGLISAKLGQAQPTTITQGQAPQAPVPQQKSFTPALVDPAGQQANQLPVSPQTGQPSQLRQIAMRKAGLL